MSAIVDLFAGPGGWDEGLRMLGRTDVTGYEWDQAACDTAEAAGHARVKADIAALDPHEAAGDDVEGLIASPPCPGFSAAGKGLGRKDLQLLLGAIDDIGSGRDPIAVLDRVRSEQHDERSALTLEPLRWAIDLEPEWIALEQVPAVLPLWQAYAEVLRADGYGVWTGNLQAEQYGVPQTRKRALLLASRTHAVAQPVPTHSRYYSRSPGKLDEGVQKWVSMAEALGWAATQIRRRGAGVDDTERAPGEPSLTVTGAGRGGSLRWQYVNGNQANSARRDLDQPAPTVHFGARMNQVDWQIVGGPQSGATRRGLDEPAPTIFSQRTGNLQWVPVAAIEGEDGADITWPYDRPSPTIVGSYAPDVVAAPGYRKAGDLPRQKTPGSVRVTVQEAAVLQSFRPDFQWCGTSTKQYQQVGNAIPPLLAAHALAALGIARSQEVAA